jgi:ParB-like chromosome segregation protein Spo0J
MAKNQGGLTKWFNEEWIDLKTGKACGRKSAKDSKRPYPSCRPKAVAAKMTKAEKERSKKKKTSSKRIKHDVTASGKRREA